MALTAVRLPLRAWGAAAATALIETIEGRTTAREQLISEPPPELVLRESTGAPPADGRMVP